MPAIDKSLVFYLQVSRRPNFTHIAARGTDGWFEQEPSAGGSIDGLKVSQNDEFCIKNDYLCTKNEEFCIKNEEFCIKNDEFCRARCTT